MKLRGRVLLDEAWRDLLDAVAAKRKFPPSGDVPALAESVVRVSRAYNTEGHDAASVPRADALAARTLFYFPRDVAKGWGATRELAAAGLASGTSALRVLDLGAGIGAMTWGLAHALAETPGSARAIDAVLLDADADALAIAREIAGARGEVAGVKVSIRAERQIAPFSASIAGGPFDVVIAGQLLSELDRELEPAERLAKHVRLVRSWLAATTEHGALVIVEPALRDRTRHLHALRAELLAARHATVFAPCLHAEACPMLAREQDWCAEDRAIDLPAWLVPVARAAGLRWEGSTFSYLVLRKDERSLAELTRSHAARFRVVSDAIVTKGKSERFLCGVAERGGATAIGKLRVTRLDRHETPENAAWNDLARGDLVAFDPAPSLREGRDEEARVDASSRVDRIAIGKSNER